MTSPIYSRVAHADETAGIRAWHRTLQNQRPGAAVAFRSFVVDGVELSAEPAQLRALLETPDIRDYLPEMGALQTADTPLPLHESDAYRCLARLAQVLNDGAGPQRHRVGTLRRDLTLAQTATLDLVETDDPICLLADQPWCAFFPADQPSLTVVVILPRLRKVKLLLATWPALTA